MRRVTSLFKITSIRITLLFILFLAFSKSGIGQDRRLKKGVQLYNETKYLEAIETLKKAREANFSAYKPVKYLANAYRKLKQFENAELYYLLAVNSDSSVSEDHLHYGQVLKANGKLQEAQNQFEKYAELDNSSFWGEIMVQSIDEIEAWKDLPENFNVTSESSLNTPMSEFGLVLFKGKVLFVSNREHDEISPETPLYDNKPFYSIFELDSSTIKRGGKSKANVISGLINSDYHDGPLTVDEQETKIIITRIDNRKKGKGFVNRMKLFEADYIEGKAKNFRPFLYNSDDYSVCHAHLSNNGKTLYFSSDMPEGYGGFDLYKSDWINNAWSEPQNLGHIINTPFDEVYPYEKDGSLYFSSDGHIGYGGLDIFFSKKEDKWQAPENLKSPINSNRDDFGICFIADSAGYFASNRIGGIGGEDIYQFEKKLALKIDESDLQVAKEKTQLHQFIFAGRLFKKLPGDINEKQWVYLTARDGTIIDSAYTDELGSFNFEKLEASYDDEFIVRLKEEDTDLNIALENTFGKVYEVLEADGKGLYVVSNSLGASLKTLETRNKGITTLMAKVEHRGLPLKLIKVNIYDKDNTLLATVFTNEDGEFQYDKLKYDESYLIELPDLNEDVLFETNIYAQNDQGDILYLIKQIKNGMYSFSTLPFEEPKIKQESTKDFRFTKEFIFAGQLFKKLPGDFTEKKMVYLVSKEGTIIDSVLTDAFGYFDFEKLKGINDDYIVRLKEEDIALNLALENTFGRIYEVIEADGNGLYVVSNSLDASLKTLEGKGKGIESLIAKVVHRGLPLKMIKVNIYDKDKTLIATVYTNEEGEFQYDKLQYDKTYFVELIGLDDDILFETKVYVQDNNGDPLYLINQLKDGTYEFNTLPFDKHKVAEENQPEYDLPDPYRFSGHIFRKLPGDFTEEKLVYFITKDGAIIDSVYTDAFGYFDFEKLKGSYDEEYIVRLKEEDVELNIALENTFGRIYEVVEADGNGLYIVSSNLDASLKALEAKNKGITALIAKAEHKGLPLKWIKINIFDHDNSLLATVYANEKGEFQYNRLQFDETYFIEIPELSEDILLETKVYLINQKGDPLYLINKIKTGMYSFNSLPYEQHEMEKLKQEEIVPNLVRIAGQIYKKLPGDNTKATWVYLLNEEGELLDSALTNEFGIFKFEKLDPEKQYKFKVPAARELNLALLDKNEALQELAYKDPRGNFAYNKLTYQIAQFETLSELDVELIDNEHQNFQLVTPDKHGDETDKTIKNENGRFTGSSLAIDNHNKHQSIENIRIYFNYKQYEIREEDKVQLDRLIAMLKQTDLVLQVHSHTDEIGSDDYNLKLSKDRTNEVIEYLIDHGISKERILGKYSGESDPLIDCEIIECDEDDYFKNRRTEFKLLESTN